MERTVLITGGTSGIGLKTAELFLLEGDRVVLLGRNEERGRQAMNSLLAVTGMSADDAAERIKYIQGSVAKVADCRRAVEESVAWGGRLDVLVNSAGIYWERAIEDVDEEAFDEMLAINLKGTTFMSKFAAEIMKKQGCGSIVNVSSDAGLQGNMLCSTYCASKGAVNLFTKAMALELGVYGIRINAVCPGDVMTPLTEAQLAQYPDREEAIREMASVYPLGRIATAQEVAGVIKFLCSKDAGFVNGALWSIDGGLT